MFLRTLNLFFILGICFSILFSCNTVKPTVFETFSIKGTILGQDSMPVPFASISVLGRNISALSDSSGTFSLDNIDSGNYDILIQYYNSYYSFRTIIKTSITDSSVNIGKVILRTFSPSNSDYVSVSMQTTKTQEYISFPSTQDFATSVDTTLLYSDSLYLYLRIYSGSLIKDAPYKIFCDSTITGSVFTIKQKATAKIFCPPGIHLFEIRDSSNYTTNKIYINNVYKTMNCLMVSLRQDMDRYVDFDLHFIDNKGDTCNYRNSNPDWGTKGNNSDDPLLKFENNDPTSSNETLLYKNIPNGKYTIMIHNFVDTSAVDSGTYGFYACDITVNDSLYHFYGKLLQNQMSIIGTLTVPEMGFVKADSTFFIINP